IKVIVDNHYDGVEPSHNFLKPIAKFIHKFAYLNIVTNDNHKQLLRKYRANAFVLPDKLPSFPNELYSIKPTPNQVLVISTFAKDEPYGEVFEAAKHLVQDNIHFYFTGNYKNKGIDQTNLPSNVHLMGYIPENKFLKAIFSATVIVDLTLMENCLVCGGYEAVAAGRPVVLSDMAVLRAYFSKGAVFCKNTAANIATSVLYAIKHSEQLQVDVGDLKRDINMEWPNTLAMLKGVAYRN
ncbi:MAG: glycosyltransferase, partial [Nitrosopumilaceae archaeon]